MKLNEIFKSYPLTVKGIALRMGRSREWLNGLRHNRLSLHDKNKAFKEVECEFRKLGHELTKIEIDGI